MANYCDFCEHYTYIGAETNEKSCEIFGDEIPDEYYCEDEDGSCGCTCSEAVLNNLIKRDTEAWLKDVKGFNKYWRNKVKK